jgi:hypothetical protein
MIDDDDAAECEKYGLHEWVRLTRHAEPGQPGGVLLANIICERCSAMGFLDIEEVPADHD